MAPPRRCRIVPENQYSCCPPIPSWLFPRNAAPVHSRGIFRNEDLELCIGRHGEDRGGTNPTGSLSLYLLFVTLRPADLSYSTVGKSGLNGNRKIRFPDPVNGGSPATTVFHCRFGLPVFLPLSSASWPTVKHRFLSASVPWGGAYSDQFIATR